MFDGMPIPILVIGVGNDFRRDDAVGLMVARSLAAESLHSVIVIEASGEGAALMAAWAGYPQVIVVDAANSGAAVGTIHRFAAHQEPMPTRFFSYSSHAFGVAEAIELARVLEQLPSMLMVFGIEGADFSTGQGLSADVERAALSAQTAIKDLILSFAEK